MEKEKLINFLSNLVKDINRNQVYIDILYTYWKSTGILKTLTDEKVIYQPENRGYVVRCYKKGIWREIATQSLENLEKIVKKVLKFPYEREKFVELENYGGWNCDQEISGDIPLDSIDIDYKYEKILELHKKLAKLDDRIVNPIISYGDSIIKRIFVNNEGCELYQRYPQIRLFVQPIVKEGNIMDFDYLSKSGQYGFELIENFQESELERVVNDSLELLNAKAAPSGRFSVILDPDMAGLVAHESFGHGLEADQVIRKRSYLEKLYNKQVASNIVNISDSPIEYRARGSFFFDDEGIKAEKTHLVKDGILINFLHERYTASALNMKPRGNGRREGYNYKLYVRMTNTFFEPGNWDLDEMIKELKEGVMLEKGFFGMEDPLGGGMQVTSKKGYLIENGEKSQVLKAITLSGSVLELLRSIDAVSKGPIQLRGGSCGKGHEDIVPVSTGGVYIKVKGAVVGPG
ncbi:MAG: TldD/PmbA family protein [Candidatus Helarchaeota archaeon]